MIFSLPVFPHPEGQEQGAESGTEGQALNKIGRDRQGLQQDRGIGTGTGIEREGQKLCYSLHYIAIL